MAKSRGDGEGVFDKRFVARGRGTVFLRTLQAEIFFFFLPLLLCLLLLKKGLVWTTLSVFQV